MMSSSAMSPSFVLSVLLGIIPSVLTFRMSTTAPVNPVEEEGILSIHCQVWDLQTNHEVRIFRTLPNRGTQKISVDEVVMIEDERFFLAKRQLDGGSFVYFMSVMDVTRKDGGEYICKVFNTTSGNIEEIGADSVDLGIVYFPSESDPSCSTASDNLKFDAGTEITLKCASEKANPTVELEWSRTGTDKVYETTQQDQGTSVYSELTLTLQKRHANAMFWCKVSSRAFPGKIATCHIGPIHIISNPNDITTTLPGKDNSLPGLSNSFPSDTSNGVDIGNGGTTRKKPKDCRTFCSSSSSVVFQWIVSTVVAACLAFIFFILGIVLLIKYHNARTDTRSQYVSNRTSERIYSELENKRQENTSYMYLHHTKPLNHEILVRDSPSGHYDGNQNMGKN